MKEFFLRKILGLVLQRYYKMDFITGVFREFFFQETVVFNQTPVNGCFWILQVCLEDFVSQASLIILSLRSLK